jgi:outer membrane protein assembly factor BamB
LVLVLVVAATPYVAADHAQLESGKSIVFDHKTGNEWWVEVVLSGTDAPSVTLVESMDTGGAWVTLPKQNWGAYGASYHIEPGNLVTFRATWNDGVKVASCQFTHPAGVERCPTPTTTPPTPTPTTTSPTPGFTASFSNVKGNEWWVETTVQSNQALAGVEARLDCQGTWTPLTLRSWGAWAASFHIVAGTKVDLRARSTSGGQALSGGYLWTAATPATGCSGTSPSPSPTTTPPPPPPNMKEAELFLTRTAGGRETSTSASGGAAWNLWSNGYIEDRISMDGTNAFAILARGTPASGTWPTMAVAIDGANAGTFTVSSSTFTEYRIPSPPAGTHTVRITFTNDLRTSTEDRNLILDVAKAAGSDATSSFTLTSGQSQSKPFTWTGGTGYVLSHVATPPDLNTKQHIRVAIDGATVADTLVAGPVPRPLLTQFALSAGPHDVRYTAVDGTVLVADLVITATHPPSSVDGVSARVHQGGFADGSSWKFTDFGYLETPLIVDESGWYELRVQGQGTVSDFGPLVHLWLNRTVIAEGVQGTTIDLRAIRHLQAGVGYGLGASFENPGRGSAARFDVISATKVPTGPPVRVPATTVGPNTPVDGWPQYGRDSYNTRYNPDPRLPSSSNAADMQLRWRTALDGSVTGTPTVVKERLYVGTWAKSFYSLNATTGAVLWRVTLPAQVDSSSSLYQGRIIVASASAVYALDATNGTTLWSRSFPGHLWASPIIEGGDLFIGVVADRGYVARLDPLTGAQVWNVAMAPIPSTGARVWASVLAPPGAGFVVVGTSPGTSAGQPPNMDSLVALNRSDGSVRWAHKFFPYDTNNETSHEITIQANRDLSGTPHLVTLNGRATVLASEKHGPAWAVDLADGSLVHGSHLLEFRTSLIGSGGVANGIEVVSSSEPDRVGAFDVATGDLLWQHSLAGTNFAPVAIGNGLVWIGSWSGQLKAYELATGREVASVDAGGGILGGVSLADGRVYVGSLQYGATPGAFYSSLGKTGGSVSMWSL